ncbi:MAG: alpha,alpha-trehalose-phosphate synthase (UDP-forming) [Actinomycetota bacterium]
MSDRPLVVLANRLPVSKVGGEWRASAGGLVTALRPVMERHSGAWVGWNGGSEDVPRRTKDFDIDLLPVDLARSEVQAYYHGFSNRTIWPLFHDLVRPPVFSRSWWDAYREVNRRFVQCTLGVKPSGRRAPLLWVQDYHLMLAPAFLREARPRSLISFFLHIPWPPPELFMRLPWRDELLHGLLGADVLSFHTDRYRKNFVRTVGRTLDDVTVRGKKIEMADGRMVATSANPISIDAHDFAEAARSNEVEQELGRLRKQFSGRRVLVGVDRLDYTKGIRHRLQAIELLLERRSDLRTRLVFLQIAVPSRGSVSEYRDLRADIEQMIGRINGRFTEPGEDVPVHYLHRGVARNRLIAYYRLADAMLVTPLKDGMNLVAKEYVVCQDATGGTGALVLSEFTGAALELPEALSSNPYDVDGLAARIGESLELSDEECRRRLRAMAGRVKRNNVFKWVERELKEVG